MFLPDYKKNYIITLVDTSENEIENSICMGGFAHHQFLMVDKDGYAISQETKEIPFSAGDVIYVAAGRRFGLRCDGSMRIRHIAFSGRNIRPLLHYCRFGEFCITSSFNQKSGIDGIFDKIFALNACEEEDKYINLSALLYTLLAKLGEINIENSSGVCTGKQLILRPMIDYMQENYRKATVSYRNIAASFCMTEKELDTLFINEYAMSAAEFYKKLRMENAKHLLFFYASVGTEYVAENMGYESVVPFEIDFYAQFGMTTDEFKKLYLDEEQIRKRV